MKKEPKQKRKSKTIHVLAKLTPQGIAIPSPASKARIALEAQKMPPQGEDIELDIRFKSKSKSSELMGFYFGGVLALWVAHQKDLLKGPNDLKRNPLLLRDLAKKKHITKQEIDDAHEDLMTWIRPVKRKDWVTGETKVGRQSLREMDAYNASLYITEVTEHVEENTGITLNTGEYKKARDTISLIIEQGPRAVKKHVELPEDEGEKPYTAFD